jgi:hypothetical protein
MSTSSAQRTYRSKRSRYIPRYRLEELFTDDELTIKLMIARFRILMAFDHATFWSHGKIRGTDNFIVGVGSKQQNLVDYVVNRIVIDMNCGIVTASELPDFVGDTSSVLRKIARRTEVQLVAVQLAMMSPADIWYNAQTPGMWQVKQSVMDTYRLDRYFAATAKKVDTQRRRESLHSGGRLMVVH